MIQGGIVQKLQSFDIELKKSIGLKKVTSLKKTMYSNNSVLSQGRFVKIRISNTGIYKLTYEDLNSMGISPADVRIFGYGGAVLDQSLNSSKIDDLPECSTWMNKGSDGVFNSGDYILFYAQGPVKWSYDKSKSMFTHTLNSYSQYGYYFVTSSAGTGKKIEERALTLPASPTLYPEEEFTDFQLHEVEKQNLVESGKDFYGETFNDITTYYFGFSFPNSVLTNSTKVRLDVAASSTSGSDFTLSLNGISPKSISIGAKTAGDFYEQAKAGNGIFSFTPTDSNPLFKITYNKTSNSDIGYLNYLEVNARRQLSMSGSVMQFQNVDNLYTGGYNQFKLSNANSNVQIWDITDQQDIYKLKTDIVDGKMVFNGPTDYVYNYLAIDPTDKNAFPSPVIVGAVANQNLHSIAQADLVIITHPDFVAQAEKLAKAHRDNDNLTAEVVTTDQVYNEFSSGTPDATAYRWIMKMLYDKASTKADLPKYLQLFGRGSYDNRKLFSNSGDNLILTYQAENSLVTTLSYTTDDYFGMLKDNQGTQVSSDSVLIGVGRLPVTTSQQATNVVNKIIGYMQNDNKGYWKNQLCYLADDGDAALHMTQADTIASSIARKFPAYQVDKIYLDAYHQEVSASGETYPLAKSKFLNLLNSGLFLLNYTGHAGATGWSNEGILSIADVRALSNQHLPLIVGATCDFLQFDVQAISGGEQVLLNPMGGGIGMISAARPVYASQNMVFDKFFCENLFKKKPNGEQMRVGDVLAIAKNAVGSEINKLSYIYMGDPALKLNYPSKYRVATSSINENTTLGSDTLNALSVATIKGYISDDSGNKISNFNGTLHAVVYDKAQRTTTQNNHNDGALTYTDRPNTLFSGDAEVKNGEYVFSFMLPKDIKYNFGSGRINYYAADNVNNNEAQGYFENFCIGGTNNSLVTDTVGPNVQLYLNSDNFVSGNKVNENPVFIANISDEHGINTVGSGIGHDVMLTIDQDPTQTYVINDYFLANQNSYTDGVVRYKLPEMKNGKHTLTFRVWDLLNNSSTTSTNFEVVKGLTPIIFKVSNYPNPVKTETNFIIEHDRPETVLSTTIEIFDIAGRKIWGFGQNSTNNIKWNLKTNDGQILKTGVYLYRVTIKTTSSDSYSKTNKMLIVEQ